jgi:hypothetical protein
MKWLKVLLSVVFLAVAVTVPIGCGQGGITEIKKSDQAGPPPGHQAEAKKYQSDMSKKPAQAQ